MSAAVVSERQQENAHALHDDDDSPAEDLSNKAAATTSSGILPSLWKVLSLDTGRPGTAASSAVNAKDKSSPSHNADHASRLPSSSNGDLSHSANGSARPDYNTNSINPASPRAPSSGFGFSALPSLNLNLSGLLGFRSDPIEEEPVTYLSPTREENEGYFLEALDADRQRRGSLSLEQATGNGNVVEDTAVFPDTDPRFSPAIEKQSFSPIGSPRTDERPRLSLNLGSLPKRPSYMESPTTPSFRRAEETRTLDPITLHSIARHDSEGEALRAISLRQSQTELKRRMRTESGNSSLGSRSLSERRRLDSSNSGSVSVSSSLRNQHSRSVSLVLPPTQQSDFGGSAGDRHSRSTSMTAASSTSILQSSVEEETASGAEGDEKNDRDAALAKLEGKASAETSSSQKASSSPEQSPATSKPKKTFLSRLGLKSNKASRSSTLQPVSPTQSLPLVREDSVASFASSTTSTASIPVHADAVNGTSGLDSPTSAYSQRLKSVRVKIKNKSTKDFRHLFLAQELDIRTDVDKIPTLPRSRTGLSATSSSFSHDQDARSSNLSLPMSSDGSHPPTASSHLNSAHTHQSQHKTKKPAVWAMEFSPCGRYLAVAGHDAVVRVWEVLSTPEQRDPPTSATLPTQNGSDAASGFSSSLPATPTRPRGFSTSGGQEFPVFQNKPVKEYVGHTSDVLDLSWSKNNFLLSSSMDKSVRLWHISRQECLCAFQHSDFVTSVAFHPRDDRFFLSGSLDCKLRLWNVPAKEVQAWTELPQLITAVSFSSDGKLAIAGSFVGQCTFFEVAGFKYHSSLQAKSTRGKNAKGRKITAMHALPSSTPGVDKLLVTSNDSRIRLFNLADSSLEAKYSGHENSSSQIRASFSEEGHLVISGSEDGHCYIWDSGVGRDEGESGWMLKKKAKPGCESFQTESLITTCSVFAPSATRELLESSRDPLFESSYAEESQSMSRGGSNISTGRPGVSSAASSHLMVPTASNGSEMRRLDSIASSVSSVTSAQVRAAAAEDAIIVTADDSSGIIRIYRNSKLPTAEKRSSILKKSSSSRRGSVALPASISNNNISNNKLSPTSSRVSVR